MTSPTHEITAPEVIRRLHGRYSAPEWAGFQELRDGPGFNQRRTIDFFAVNTWPSKGLTAVAVEVKVSRADFRRELDNPDKRATIIPHVNEFWFACTRGIIEPKEVPDGCGLLETWGDDKLRATIRAKQFMERSPDRGLWTVIARRCAMQIAQTNKDLMEFAEFKGRSVSLEDLRRLANKMSYTNDMKRRIRNEVMDELREESKSRRDCLLSGEWITVLRKLWQRIKDIDADLDWRSPPDPARAYQFLELLKVDQDRAELANRLRDVADTLDPTNSVEVVE